MYELNGTQYDVTLDVITAKAKRMRIRDRVEVTVVDADSRELVLYSSAPKPIRQIEKYTRVVALPDGIEVPYGMRPAYIFKRSNGVVLYDHNARTYRIMNLKTGKLLQQSYSTAAAAGARVSHGVGTRQVG